MAKDVEEAPAVVVAAGEPVVAPEAVAVEPVGVKAAEPEAVAVEPVGVKAAEALAVEPATPRPPVSRVAKRDGNRI